MKTWKFYVKNLNFLNYNLNRFKKDKTERWKMYEKKF